jgi:hypothetical protein
MKRNFGGAKMKDLPILLSITRARAGTKMVFTGIRPTFWHPLSKRAFQQNN